LNATIKNSSRIGLNLIVSNTEDQRNTEIVRSFTAKDAKSAKVIFVLSTMLIPDGIGKLGEPVRNLNAGACSSTVRAADS
jgi:hypothetical protein